ncbi:MAG TPA: PH domain-containing protein [Pseudonocardiaceae bacterium]|nr:PH domain-containing protein [Pseudonocardiaceae bacterium]
MEQAGPTASAPSPQGQRAPLVVRPHKVRQVVIPVAVLLVVIFVILAVLLNSSSTGVHFGLSDQISMIAIGLLFAAGVLLLARPKVRADSHGVEVRNLLFGQVVPWTLIKGVSFPDGAPWARLELPQDEYVPVVAIQAADGERAVRAIRELRAWYRAAGTPAQDSATTTSASTTKEARA